MTNKYSLVIRWSDEDQCFIAWVPELGSSVKTHGDTYEEAARMGQEVIESFFQPETAKCGERLPPVWKYSESKEDQRVGALLFPNNESYYPAPPMKQKIA